LTSQRSRRAAGSKKTKTLGIESKVSKFESQFLMFESRARNFESNISKVELNERRRQKERNNICGEL
jgi:hypothetical protein